MRDDVGRAPECVPGAVPARGRPLTCLGHEHDGGVARALARVACRARAAGDRDAATDRMVRVAERWLDGRRVRGEARRKEGEGMEGRWVLVKT